MLHLIKLCVGCDSVEDLTQWQRKRSPLEHWTRNHPKRGKEIVTGGSLYWVIKGFVLVRQRVLDLRPDAKDDGTACCGIVLDKELVATRAHPRRAFQGWRYLEVADAPKDAGVVDAAVEDMPRGMRDELRELRLIDW